MNGAHIALTGRVTRPGELRYTQNGHAMLRVGVLVDDSKRRDDDPAEFADLTIWGEQAEQMADRLPKGAMLYAEGRVKARAYTASDGTARATLDISAWKCEPLGQIGRQAPRRGPVGEPTPLGAGTQPRNTRAALGLDDDDLTDVPF